MQEVIHAIILILIACKSEISERSAMRVVVKKPSPRDAYLNKFATSRERNVYINSS